MESPFLPGFTQERASLTSTLSAKDTDRMGSGCGGERQGQETRAAITASPQSATSLGPADLAGGRSDSSVPWKRATVQLKESIRTITNGVSPAPGARILSARPGQRDIGTGQWLFGSLQEICYCQ